MSGVWWCSKCRVPLLRNLCEKCGSSYSKPISKDLNPVFAKEMNLLKNTFNFDCLPKKASDFYLWNSGQYYFINGIKVATLKFNNTNNPTLNVHIPNDFKMPRWRKKIKENYVNVLFQANRSSLNAIEYEAIQFIQETKKQYSPYALMVAVSGGKDSTVVSDLVRKALGMSEILHVMSDTTIEASDTYSYVNEFHKHHPKVPLIKLTPTLDFYEVSLKIGPPSRLRRWCCTTHKANQMANIIAALRKSNPGVLTFEGVRSAESTRRAKYDRVSTKHKIKGEIISRPIQKWLSIHVWLYIITKNLHFNEAYRLGFRRVGCLPCPFNSRWSNYLTKIYYPNEDSKWRKFLFQFASKIGHPNPQHFCEEGWETRAGGRGQKGNVTELNKEVCIKREDAYTYELIELSDSLLEFIKPFGNFNVLYDDGLIMKGSIVKNKKLVANIKIVRPMKTLRIEFDHFEKKKMLLLVSRFEKQLKKYQSCILCGSCNMHCIKSAISANGRYYVDTEKCIHCLECVRSNCIALDSLSSGKTSKSWRICDGSN